MYTQPKAPRTIGGVLDDSIRLYRASFARCWVLALILSVVSGAFGVYEAMLMQSLNGASRAPGVAGLAASMVQLQQAEKGHHVWLWNLLVTLFWLVLETALIVRQNAVAIGLPDTLGSALAFALRRLPSLIAAGIAWAVAIGVGFVVLVIPGIWLAGQLQLWLPALVAEDIGPLKALGRSWNLVERNWWRASTTVGVAAVIVGVLSLAGGLPAILVVLVRADVVSTLMLTQLLAVIIRVFTTPLLTAVWVAVYYDLRLRRDGGDLAARVSTLQAV